MDASNLEKWKQDFAKKQEDYLLKAKNIQIETINRPMWHLYRRLLTDTDFFLVNNSGAGLASDQAWLDLSDARAPERGRSCRAAGANRHDGRFPHATATN